MSKKTVFGTREWADLSCNCVRGCENNCLYCFAKANAIKNKISTASEWVKMREELSMADKVLAKKGKRVMFPTSHDITEAVLKPCLETIEKILRSDPERELLIVSKPKLSCTRAICDLLDSLEDVPDVKDRVLFRFTIGSTSDEILSFWEPNAPSFYERTASLILACKSGFRTSISCEPMLDDNIGELIFKLREYVTDSIWLGVVNFAEDRIKTNCKNMPQYESILDACRRWEKFFNEDYIKELYDVYKDDPIIKWKESIKKVVGLEIPTEAGLDI